MPSATARFCPSQRSLEDVESTSLAMTRTGDDSAVPVGVRDGKDVPGPQDAPDPWPDNGQWHAERRGRLGLGTSKGMTTLLVGLVRSCSVPRPSEESGGGGVETGK